MSCEDLHSLAGGELPEPESGVVPAGKKDCTFWVPPYELRKRRDWLVPVVEKCTNENIADNRDYAHHHFIRTRNLSQKLPSPPPRIALNLSPNPNLPVHTARRNHRAVITKHRISDRVRVSAQSRDLVASLNVPEVA